MAPRINLITLGVEALSRSIDFYQALGFPRYPYESEEIAFFQLHGSWFALYPKQALAEDAGVSVGDSGFHNFTLAHNVTDRDSVDRIMDEALSAGARLVKPAQEAFWGGYTGCFADPDGFIWEVAHVPGFWIGPKPEDEA
ncbi:MAG: glyoxalase [gamma proteobacterium symbiont of Ctena orbiculata]|nr:MAG: glyoxalase [gamma proteobacterium symbiont of Ctena orbiculata]PVV22038.1 MAG: glyoxalase [gamma proteobacterium symbiont of Ctena orbiculata]PVV25291.1 MAG: glyoxalase [gamma proteobacterium symbiont of Ctena orbiculata]